MDTVEAWVPDNQDELGTRLAAELLSRLIARPVATDVMRKWAEQDNPVLRGFNYWKWNDQWWVFRRSSMLDEMERRALVSLALVRAEREKDAS